jgi:hypothetical protein
LSRYRKSWGGLCGPSGDQANQVLPGIPTDNRCKLEHFQEKWNPVFRPKMRQRKNARAVSVSSKCENRSSKFRVCSKAKMRADAQNKSARPDFHPIGRFFNS